MKIFSAKEVQEIDQYTIQNEPVKSIDLMERAAYALLNWYQDHFDTNQKIIILAGPGNNGGDALALARLLLKRQYNVESYLISASGKISEDCKENMNRLSSIENVKIKHIKTQADFPELLEQYVVVDGIFGSGLSREVEGLYGELIKHVNISLSIVVSVDIPSGLFAEDNSTNNLDSIIRAHYTLTFQFPFLSFFFAENYQYTGRWEILDIKLNADIIESKESVYTLINRSLAAKLLPERAKFAHKGTFGHALLIAGSYGMMGAAVLAGEAALRSGAGLVSVHVPKIGYNILQVSVPELIVSIDEHDHYFSSINEIEQYAAIGAGPGLGNDPISQRGLESLLKRIHVPLLLDADALNLIAAKKTMLSLLPENTIITPHPGEFDRLTEKSLNSWNRHLKQIEFSIKYKLIVILKGAFTGISFPNGKYFFNSSGNPGMATGGSGDVLSGIIVSLLAEGLDPANAAIAGVYLHGLAGDFAAKDIGEDSMIAGDISKNLSRSFKELRTNPFFHEGRTGGRVF